MSNGAMNPLEEFVKLLTMTINPDNQLRQNAENHLKSIDKETKLNYLLQTLVSNSSLEILEIAAVTMRRTIDRLGNLNKLSSTAVSSLKTALPQLCLHQMDQNLRSKYVYIISAIFDLCMNEQTNHWPELNQFFYDCLIRSNHDIGIEISLRLLDSSPNILTQFPEDHFPNIMKIICETLLRDLNNNKKLVILAVKGFSSIAIDISFKKIHNYLDSPIKILLQIISHTSEVDIISAILQELTVIAECKSKVFRNHLDIFVNTMIGLLQSQHHTNEIRTEVMECIVTLAEHSPKAFKTKTLDLLPQLVDVFIRHVTILHEDPEWAFTSGDEGEDEEEDISTSAETSLDRLTCAIGGKIMLPIIIAQVTPLLSSKIWQHRCAALITISCTAEGCKKQIKPSLSKLLDLIVPYIKDPQPRVVFSCINCVGQMAVDFIGYFHQNFHQQIFPAIFYASEHYTECPRVQAHAVCCFVNLLDGCPKKVLETYSDHFMNRLRVLFVFSVSSLNKPGIPMVLENVLSSLAKFAESTGSSFEKYYNYITPDLIILTRQFISTPHIKYFIASLDALSSILLAVGQETCRTELNNVLDILKQFEINSINVKNSEENYMLQYLEIITKIAQVLGDSFEPILPTFMPKLMELISSPIESNMISSKEEFDCENGIEDEGFRKLVSAHTDALGDKYRACQILQQICENMKNGMANHCDQILDVMIKNLTECYDDDIQNSACEIFPVLLKSSQTKGIGFTVQLWCKIFSAFFHRITQNNGYFTSDKAFDSMRECIDIVGYNGLGQDIISRIVELMNFEIVRLVKNSGNKLTSCLSDDDLEEYEDGDNDDLLAEDNEETDIIMSIQVLHEKLFKILKDNFLPFFQNLFDNILLLVDCKNVDFRFYGIAMISDLVEHCPSGSFTYQSKFFPKVVEGLLDNNPNIGQTSCFVIGMMAEHGGKMYETHLSQCTSQLYQVITRPNSKEEEFSTITANAIAAFGRIMKYCPSILPPLDKFIECWISWLPVIEDEVEFVLGYLLELIETQYSAVIGANNINLTHVLDSIAHMIPYVDDCVTIKAMQILSQLRTHLPIPFENWYNNLSQTLKDNLEYGKDACIN